MQPCRRVTLGRNLSIVTMMSVPMTADCLATELSDKRVFGGREIEVLAQFLIE
jgi:hypothetical protein